MGADKLTSANFEFLRLHDPLLVALGAQAERYFADDPSTALIKLRQFGEVLARQAAALLGVLTSQEASQLDLINRLRDKGALTPQVRQLFHDLRQAGNAAAHEVQGTHAEALHHLKMARELGVWFHRSFKDKAFKPGPFIPPSNPANESEALAAEIENLRAEVHKPSSPWNRRKRSRSKRRGSASNSRSASAKTRRSAPSGRALPRTPSGSSMLI